MTETINFYRQALPEENKYDTPEGYVAILLATYNGEQYLEEQLESLRTQTHQNFICYIHDDGSADSTQAIVESYCNNHHDHFIYMGSSQTGGAKFNFMYMLRNVKADYYMFCDQDDVWLPEKIEKTYRLMRQTEDENASQCPTCVFTDAMVVDEKLSIINGSFYTYSGTVKPNSMELCDLIYRNLAPGCTLLINSHLRKKALMIDDIKMIRMHDWFLTLIAASEGKLVRISEPLLYYRQHEHNAIGAHKDKTKIEKVESFLRIKKWVAKKNQFFDGVECQAKAVLAVLEMDHNIPDKIHKHVEEPKINKNIVVIQKFLKQQNAPLVVKLVKFYHWKWKK